MRSESLPAEWVERIFKRLSVRYGQAFLRRWDGLDMAEVHADWAEQLGAFKGSAARIAYALDHMQPDRPPTVGEFRAMCNAMPTPTVLALPAPRTEPPAAVAQKLAVIKVAGHDPKAWAKRLQAREEAGEKLPLFSKRAWREALGVPKRAEQEAA